MNQPRQPSHKSYHHFLKAIRPTLEAWPYKEEDWAEAKAWQDQGVDLATTTGDPLKVNLFGRLAKLARKNSPLTPQQRVAPFFHLAKLTEGRALAPKFSQEWASLAGVSFVAITSDPSLYESLFKLFMYKREAQTGPASDSENFTWLVMQKIAVSLDRPDLFDQLLELAPKNQPVLVDVFYGGPRMLGWLVQHHGEALIHNTPTDPDLGIHGQRLQDYIGQRGVGFGIQTHLNAWLAVRGQSDALDKALPEGTPAEPDIRRGPRF